MQNEKSTFESNAAAVISSR